MTKKLYSLFLDAAATQTKLLAILIDPDVFSIEGTAKFLQEIPTNTTHLFVGGSTVEEGKTAMVVAALKEASNLPIVLFPGDVSQIDEQADGILFLSLLSGRNPEYLIGQHVRAVPILRVSNLEVLPTAYLLIDGGKSSAVARVTGTDAMLPTDVQLIVDTAKAGELLGAKLIYLEAGSGAATPVSESIIRSVKEEVEIPLLVGGGIRTLSQLQQAYSAGADMVIMGTVFEEQFKQVETDK
ncbi:MAG: geranylgeranylglyceryl/heptaprenylglyceryl phosphate synthase [Marinirhabdus sp.]|nr:geranylgeranylglyceryl/heptaprenylglyceryl phosphate synthase [Marinirhabdus sp.]